MEYGYAALLPGGRHPVACLFVEIDPQLVDFNVHPAKREARFRNLAPLHQAVVRVVQEVAPQFGHRSPLAATDPPPAGRLPFTPARPAAPAAPAPAAQPEPAAEAAATATAAADRAAAAAAPTPAAAATVTPGPSAVPTGAAGTTVMPDVSGGLRYVGQALGLFLLVEIGSSLYFVDQHAAHERVLYEELRRRAFPIQQLLLPIELELDAAAVEAVSRACGLLRGLGIVIEREAGRPARITALAEPLHQLPAEWLRDYVAGVRGSEADLERAVLADMACKLAVKDGEVLDPAAATTIVRRSFDIDLQHCPHGRPLWYSVARQQLVKRVGR